MKEIKQVQQRDGRPSKILFEVCYVIAPADRKVKIYARTASDAQDTVMSLRDVVAVKSVRKVNSD